MAWIVSMAGRCIIINFIIICIHYNQPNSYIYKYCTKILPTILIIVVTNFFGE